MVEHRSPKPAVGGSSPSWPAIYVDTASRMRSGVLRLAKKGNVLTMSAKAEDAGRFDGLKWSLVALLVAGGVGGNIYFSSESLLYRVIALLVLALIAGYIAYGTVKGEAFFELLKGARTEIRKVVWPSRQESTQTTLIVVAFVVVAALILWGLDTLLGWLASMVIG